MNSEEQAVMVRTIYYKCRERYYEYEFRLMLSALSVRNPDYYNARKELIYVLMNAAENALLRGEINRGLRYVLCFQSAVSALEKKMKSDCHIYWNNLPID